MLDRAGYLVSNDFFRFSTKEKQWEQLNATRVSETRRRRSSARGQGPRFVRGMLRTLTRAAGGRQLGVKRISGSPPSARSDHGMVSVGRTDLYIFGGSNGEEGLCDDGHFLSGCQTERTGDAPCSAAVPVEVEQSRALLSYSRTSSMP
jgi:hypothetical protein